MLPSRSQILSALTAGGAFAVSALVAIFSSAIMMGVIADPAIFGLSWLSPMLVILPVVTAFCVGTVSWLFILGDRITVRRGGMVGLIVGLATHPVIWFGLAFGSLVFGYPAFVAHDPVALASEALTVTYISLLWTGWITGPIGGVTGALLGHWQS